MKGETEKILFHSLAILTVVIWGVTFISTKVLILSGLRPEEIFVVRFIIAYLGLLAVSHRKLWSDSLRDELLMMLLGVTGGSVYFWTENTALEYGLANNVAFIVCCAPLLTTLLLVMVDKHVRPSRRFYLGTLLALMGMGMVIFNGRFILKLNPLGDMLALAAALCWAFYTLIIRKVEGRYDTLFVTRKVFFWGLMTILPLFLYKPWSFPLAGFLQARVLLNILFLGIVASLICFAVWNLVIKKIGALSASNYIYLNPASTLVASYLILSEPLTVLSIAGFAIILLGLYIANKAL